MHFRRIERGGIISNSNQALYCETEHLQNNVTPENIGEYAVLIGRSLHMEGLNPKYYNHSLGKTPSIPSSYFQKKDEHGGNYNS